MYLSKSDAAIGFSTWAFASRHRVGRISRDDLPPFMQQRSDMVQNVSLIDAQVNAGFIGHSYSRGRSSSRARSRAVRSASFLAR